MSELTSSLTDEIPQRFHCTPNNAFFYHQYAQCGGSGLETLAEASSEEESVKDDSFTGLVDTSESETFLSRSFSLELEGIHTFTKTQKRKCFEKFTSEECEPDAHKIFLLESIIQQLRDELRECKDQNELLEFRLLEIEEAHSNNKQAETIKTEVTSSDISDIPLHDDEVMREENAHATVTESRSSCSSDCSESLSLQESGIFDGQGSDDGFPSPRSGKSHISRELANLTFQIEELLRRYNEGTDSRQEKRLDTLERSKVDLASDLSYCRQRIQEFEKRLSQMNDITYMRSLEDKVNSLLVENKRLEQERTEIEEAENDNRYLCQRLEEKVRQLKKKKITFQSKLEEEMLSMEHLRKEILQLETENENLCIKLAEQEVMIQNHEQRNFELEEHHMEMRCSVQLVTRSIPVISVLYLYFHFPQYLGKIFCSLQHQSHVSNPRSIMFCSTLKNARKHKRPDFQLVEPTQKRCKGLRDTSGGVLCWNGSTVTLAETGQLEMIRKCNIVATESQTDDEMWKTFVHEMITKLKIEWEMKETDLLTNIQKLEHDITKLHDAFGTERGQIIKIYEQKLGEKESELKQIRQLQDENQDLQEKWNLLIQELEQFSLYFGRNLCEEPQLLSRLADPDEIRTFSKFVTDEEMSQSDTAFISTLTSQRRRGKSNNNKFGNDDTEDPFVKSMDVDYSNGFKWKEPLLCEIDRLLSKVKADGEAKESNMVTHLMEENKRLQSLFQDHDKAWGDFKQLQEENERLRSELNEMEVLKTRLEDTQRNEIELRERLEEVERVEANLRNQLTITERKESKGTEKIHQLREELQFLRSKCCQLQDDLDGRAARETKYKSEIQMLATKVRESTIELEERESQLETTENEAQAQIGKLKTQLQELYQTYSDIDCSNGMLKEEVSYLEKTVEEAVMKGVKNESTITALSHELKQKDCLIEELNSQLRQMRIVDSQPLSLESPHELSDFNCKEGGLNGVVRSVTQVASLIKQCKQCETLGTKVMEIGNTLIPLIQILKSTHVDSPFLAEPEVGMTRCESDEVLIKPKKLTKPVVMEENAGNSLKVVQSLLHGPEHFAEEDEILISRLQQTMTRLTLQITNLEESLNIRQAEMKDSHIMEIGLWKYRCEEKNMLIQLLARRISHLSATDVEGLFIRGILKEIKKLENEFAKRSLPPEPKLIPWQPDQKRKRSNYSNNPSTHDFSFRSLQSFLTSEHRKILELLESVSSGSIEESGDEDNHVSNDTSEERKEGSGSSFRVVRKIGDDALLCSWTVPERGTHLRGYEIAVNGSTYLKIPKANRHKAVLFGLNLEEPLNLTFKCISGGHAVEESTITFIS